MNIDNILKEPQYNVLEGSELTEVIESMAKNLGEQDKPMVGIFWYDNIEEELFGVDSAFADELSFDSNGKKTTKQLHKDFWAKQHKKAKHSKNINKIFLFDDYTKIPRGRVFQYSDGSFHIMCGDWIEDYPEAIDMIKDEFNLQDVDLIINKNYHWNIGHGWIGDFQ